jgi:DNA-binding transcriptional MerR regulator
MAYSTDSRKTAGPAPREFGGVIIPDKLYFKIGEVCDIVGVEPHVLRYWEQEFPQLTPQKNSAGQRVYRKKDVEVALRIKALREEEGFTIAGAKKRLAAERGSASKLKVVPIERSPDFQKAEIPPVIEELVADVEPETIETAAAIPRPALSADSLAALRRIRAELEDVLAMLK